MGSLIIKFIVSIVLALVLISIMIFWVAPDILLKIPKEDPDQTKKGRIPDKYTALPIIIYENWNIIVIKITAMFASNKKVIKWIRRLGTFVFSVYAFSIPLHGMIVVTMNPRFAKHGGDIFVSIPIYLFEHTDILIAVLTLLITIITLVISVIFFIFSQQKIPLHNRNFLKGEVVWFFINFIIIALINSVYLGILSVYNISFIDYGRARTIALVSYFLIMVTLIWIFIKAVRTMIFSYRIRQTMYDWATYELFLYIKPFFKSIFLDRQLQFSRLLMLQEDAFLGLKYSIDNNLIRDFTENYTKWHAMLYNQNTKLFSSESFPLEEMCIEFAVNYKDFYERYYESLFLSHVRLIAQLNSINDPMSEKVLKDYFEFPIPANETLYKIHFEAIWHLVKLTLHSRKDITFQLMYDFIVQHVQNDIARKPNQTNVNSLFSLFKSFVRLAIDTYDMRLLIETSHILVRCSDILQSSSINSEDVNLSIELNLDKYSLGITKGLKSSVSRRGEITEIWISQTAKILLEAALEAMAIGQLEQVGFIVKFIITGLESCVINTVFELLLNGVINSNNADYQDDGNSIYYEYAAGIYSIQKLGILLYGQQWYIQEKGVNFRGMHSPTLLSKRLLTSNYTGYLIDKLTDSADSFRLLFLKDSYFMGRMLRSLL